MWSGYTNNPDIYKQSNSPYDNENNGGRKKSKKSGPGRPRMSAEEKALARRERRIAKYKIFQEDPERYYMELTANSQRGVGRPRIKNAIRPEAITKYLQNRKLNKNKTTTTTTATATTTTSTITNTNINTTNSTTISPPNTTTNSLRMNNTKSPNLFNNTTTTTTTTINQHNINNTNINRNSPAAKPLINSFEPSIANIVNPIPPHISQTPMNIHSLTNSPLPVNRPKSLSSSGMNYSLTTPHMIPPAYNKGKHMPHTSVSTSSYNGIPNHYQTSQPLPPPPSLQLSSRPPSTTTKTITNSRENYNESVTKKSIQNNNIYNTTPIMNNSHIKDNNDSKAPLVTTGTTQKVKIMDDLEPNILQCSRDLPLFPEIKNNEPTNNKCEDRLLNISENFKLLAVTDFLTNFGKDILELKYTDNDITYDNIYHHLYMPDETTFDFLQELYSSMIRVICRAESCRYPINEYSLQIYIVEILEMCSRSDLYPYFCQKEFFEIPPAIHVLTLHCLSDLVLETQRFREYIENIDNKIIDIRREKWNRDMRKKECETEIKKIEEKLEELKTKLEENEAANKSNEESDSASTTKASRASKRRISRAKNKVLRGINLDIENNEKEKEELESEIEELTQTNEKEKKQLAKLSNVCSFKERLLGKDRYGRIYWMCDLRKKDHDINVLQSELIDECEKKLQNKHATTHKYNTKYFVHNKEENLLLNPYNNSMNNQNTSDTVSTEKEVKTVFEPEPSFYPSVIHLNENENGLDSSANKKTVGTSSSLSTQNGKGNEEDVLLANDNSIFGIIIEEIDYNDMTDIYVNNISNLKDRLDSGSSGMNMSTLINSLNTKSNEEEVVVKTRKRKRRGRPVKKMSSSSVNREINEDEIENYNDKDILCIKKHLDIEMTESSQTTVPANVTVVDQDTNQNQVNTPGFDNNNNQQQQQQSTLTTTTTNIINGSNSTMNPNNGQLNGYVDFGETNKVLIPKSKFYYISTRNELKQLVICLNERGTRERDLRLRLVDEFRERGLKLPVSFNTRGQRDRFANPKNPEDRQKKINVEMALKRFGIWCMENGMKQFKPNKAKVTSVLSTTTTTKIIKPTYTSENEKSDFALNDLIESRLQPKFNKSEIKKVEKGMFDDTVILTDTFTSSTITTTFSSTFLAPMFEEQYKQHYKTQRRQMKEIQRLLNIIEDKLDIEFNINAVLDIDYIKKEQKYQPQESNLNGTNGTNDVNTSNNSINSTIDAKAGGATTTTTTTSSSNTPKGPIKKNKEDLCVSKAYREYKEICQKKLAQLTHTMKKQLLNQENKSFICIINEDQLETNKKIRKSSLDTVTTLSTQNDDSLTVAMDADTEMDGSNEEDKKENNTNNNNTNSITTTTSTTITTTTPNENILINQQSQSSSLNTTTTTTTANINTNINSITENSIININNILIPIRYIESLDNIKVWPRLYIWCLILIRNIQIRKE